MMKGGCGDDDNDTDSGSDTNDGGGNGIYFIMLKQSRKKIMI